LGPEGILQDKILKAIEYTQKVFGRPAAAEPEPSPALTVAQTPPAAPVTPRPQPMARQSATTPGATPEEPDNGRPRRSLDTMLAQTHYQKSRV
jgi:hypothetical protein